MIVFRKINSFLLFSLFLIFFAAPQNIYGATKLPKTCEPPYLEYCQGKKESSNLFINQ